MSTPTLITFLLYLVGMLALGFAAYRITHSLSDYILGGRRLGPVVAALSAGASDMSGWLLLGLPGAIYTAGLNQTWIAVGLMIGAYLNWRFVAARLRRYTELARDSLTLPDYLENRFHDSSRMLRFVSSVVILFFFTVYAAAGLVGGAILFEKTFGLDYRTALLVATTVIVAYTFLGGFLAVSWTDTVQGMLMLAALLLVPIMAIAELGGWSATIDRIEGLDTAFPDIFSGMSALSLVSLMAWGLGYFGQPHILARFMAIRSSQDVPKARLVAMVWMGLSLLGAVLTGFVAIGMFAERPLANPETAFIGLTQVLFNPWIAGVLLAAVLAAIMSTVDSQLLVCSSAIAEDLYRGLIRREGSDRELVWISRGAVIAVALMALVIALDPESRVLDLVAYAWAGFGAGFGPAVVLSVLWRGATRNGALAGMVAGAVVVVIWANLRGGVFDVYEILPGFIAGLVVNISVSLSGKPPGAKIVSEFDRV